ncbi:MAG: MFS transporter [Gaiellaceae bacterium]
MRRGNGVLRRAPGFRYLFLATLASGVGTWIAAIALTVDIYDRTGSGTWVSALLIADFLPTVAIGLTLGPLVDRFPRRALMIAADVVRLAVFCALPFTDSPGAIVALAAVAGFATGFFKPAARAEMPNLVPDEDLPKANALFQSAESLTNTAGPFVGGALVAVSGPHVAYWLNAITFLASALLIMRVPQRVVQGARALGRSHLRDLGEGFSIVLRSRALLTVLVAWSLVTISNAGVNVAEVFLAKEVFESGDFGFGVLSAGFGAGLVIGSFSTSALLARRGIASVYGGSIMLMAFGIGAAAISPNVWVATACAVVSGSGNGAAIVSNSLFVQRGVPDRLRGRAFSVIMSTNFAFLGLGMVGAGKLTDAFGARWVWGSAAVVAGIAAVVAYILASGVDAAALSGRADETPEPEAMPPPKAAIATPPVG